MKKQLTALAVIGCMMTATAQAFVPLSNSQINLGSFRNNATRGMFYTELDIFSASPVEIGDTEGNFLYTNWANLRTGANTVTGSNINYPGGPGAGTYDAALGYNTIGNAGALSGRTLTLGLSGQPLWFLPVVKGIRGGAVFQNSGNKAGSFNMDGDAGGTFDHSWKYAKDTYTITYTTNGVNTRDLNQTSDLNYVTDTSNNQWDAGAGWKGFILKDFDIGASLSRQTNQILRTTGGTRTLTNKVIDPQDDGALGNGIPLKGNLNEYTATFAANTNADRNSNSVTDVLAQARIGFIPFITSVSAGAGLRITKNDNPGSGLMDENGMPIAAPFEKDGVDLSLKDLVAVSSIAAGVGVDTQTRLRETTRSRDNQGVGVPTPIDYFTTDAAMVAATPTTFYTTSLLVAAPTPTQRATANYKDGRSGAGPLARLEVMKKFDKVKISAVGNFSTVKQTVDASQQLRAFSKDISPVLTTRTSTYLVTDYTQNRAWAGSQTTRNLAGGVKFDFIAMDGVSLALGGFISQFNTVSDITSATFDTTEKTSYDDANAATNSPLIQFLPGFRPSPVNGEGTWTQTMSRKITGKVDALTTQISVPVGVEIPLAKKWTFRAGTRYILQKTKITTTSKLQESKTVTVVTAAGATQPTTTYTTTDVSPVETTVVSYPVPGAGVPAAAAGVSSPSETHFMEYSYGIQFDPTKSLSLAANAFLDTNPGNPDMPGISKGQSASILDLNTYRLLAIQAVFKF